MVESIFTAIQGIYLFAVAMGITTGCVFGVVLLVFRHRRSGVYGDFSIGRGGVKHY